MRFVVLILLLVLAVWLIRRALAASRNKENREGARGQASSAGGDLVRCARCGVHLPRAEALLAGGDTFCGEEHARLGTGGR